MGRWSCVERLASEVTYDQKPIEELCGKRRLLKIVPGNSVLYVRPHIEIQLGKHKPGAAGDYAGERSTCSGK